MVTRMAEKIQALFTDDMDGSPADVPSRFALDGTSYEIDLNAQHAQTLRALLSRTPARPRKAPGARPGPAANPAPAPRTTPHP